MDMADSLARFLRVGVGHEVRVAYDGASGVRMATADVPDVVVCDIAMPKLGGLRVAEELSRLTPRPLLIAVTGYGGQFPEGRGGRVRLLPGQAGRPVRHRGPDPRPQGPARRG